MREQLAVQKILRERFEDFRLKNPSYSIRAFSRKLGVSPATLSLVFNGKRKASRKLAHLVVKKLMLDPQEHSELLSLFPAKGSSRQMKTETVDPFHLQLTADQYQILADWRAFAILGLIEMPGFKSDPAWISDRIESSPSEISKILERLKRLRMIVEDKNGNFKRAHPKYRTTDDIANLSIRKGHAQTLELAAKSLERDDVSDRDFTWLTLQFDKKKLPEAKTLIRKFQDDLDAALAVDAQPTEIYRLAIQLFPLTRSKNNKNEKRGS